MDLRKLKKEIDALEEVVDKKLSKFDDKWNYNRGFDEYEEEREKAGGKELIKYRELSLQYNMNRKPKLTELSEYGDVMSLEEFKSCCECGGFIDYDGYGRYVKDDKETDIYIRPSDVKKGNVRKEFDKVIWFNR